MTPLPRPSFSAAAAGLALVALVGTGACAADRAGPPRVGDPLPSFHAALLRDAPEGSGVVGAAGDTVAFADLQGRPALVNLWATWCPPCREETPYLQAVSERWGARGLEVVGITVDTRSQAGSARDFLDEAGARYLQLHDPAMASMDLFGVPGLPATFLVDAGGTIRWTRLGPVEEGDAAFEAVLDSLVAERP